VNSVKEIVDEAHGHAVNLEQCSIFVDGAPLKRSMTDAAEFLKKLIEILNRPDSRTLAEKLFDRLLADPEVRAGFDEQDSILKVLKALEIIKFQADQFEVYADDQDAYIRKGWVKGTEVKQSVTKAEIWRAAAQELRRTVDNTMKEIK
jgi:hypothetical protein